MSQQTRTVQAASCIGVLSTLLLASPVEGLMGVPCSTRVEHYVDSGVQYRERETYQVKSGDTLWAIAGKHLDNPFAYTVIAELNMLKNPDKIFPDQTLVLRMTPHYTFEFSADVDTGDVCSVHDFLNQPILRVYHPAGTSRDAMKNIKF